MTAPHHYCFINGPLLIRNDNVPDTSRPRVHVFTGHLEFPLHEGKHETLVHAYTPEPPAELEVVSFWGSAAHNGSLDESLQIFATSMERFPWADLDSKHT